MFGEWTKNTSEVQINFAVNDPYDIKLCGSNTV